MANPWEKYQQAPTAAQSSGDGPWAKYASPTATTADGSTIPVDVVTPGQDVDSLTGAFYAAKAKGDEPSAVKAFQAIRSQGATLRGPNADELVALNKKNGASALGSDLDNYRAGIGKSVFDRARGVGQAAASIVKTAISPTNYILRGLGEQNPIGDAASAANDYLKQAQSDASDRDSALIHTKAGIGGYITGEAGQLIAPAAYLKASSAIRGVQASPGVMSALAPTTYDGAAIQGALIGGTEPLTADQSDAARIKNAAIGGGVGLAGQAGARLVGATFRGARALVDPLFAGGQQRIVANGLARAGENAAINATPSAVPGVAPTLAEATGNAGIGRLTSSLADADTGFNNQLVGRQLDNNAARLKVLQDIAGSDDAIASAKAARATQANDLYGTAASFDADRSALRQVTADANVSRYLGGKGMYSGAKGAGSVKAAVLAPSDTLQALSKRPAMQSAIQDAKTLAANSGVSIGENPLNSVQGLHYVKLALDDALNVGAQQGIGNVQKAAITGTRESLIDEIGKIAPDYIKAKDAFKAASGPINQMELGSELLGRSVRPELDPLGNPTILPGKYARNIANLDAIAQKATGFKGAKAADVLSPEQLKSAQDVLGDLSRKSIADNLGRSRGSNTVQNLAGQNLVSEVTKGVGLPGLADTEVGKAASSMLNKVYSIVGVPERLKERLGQVLLNPDAPESKAILALIPKAMRPAIEAKLGPIFGTVGQVTRIGVSQQAALQR